MKRFQPLIFIFVISWSSLFGLVQDQPISAESAIMINADTGKILYVKNPHQKLFPASITKIATAAYVLATATNHLDDLVEATQDDIGAVKEEEMRRSNYTLPAYRLTFGAAHVGVKKGEILSLRDMIYGMMVASGCDVSNIIARYVGGSVPAFMKDLNLYLKNLGCTNTEFLNPHGLHHPKHVTTVADMAILAREAMKNPLFAEIVSTVQYQRPKTNMQGSTTWMQTNKLLKKGELFYPYAIGVKTGFHSAAKHSLVSAARKDGRTLILVQMKTEVRNKMFQEAAKLFEVAFNEKKETHVILSNGVQKHARKIKGASHPISTYVEEGLTVSYYPSEPLDYKVFLAWDPAQLPIRAGERLGEIQLKNSEGRMIKAVPLLAGEDVAMGWIYYLLHPKKWSWGITIFFGILFIVGSGLSLVLYRGRQNFR